MSTESAYPFYSSTTAIGLERKVCSVLDANEKAGGES